MIVDNCAMRLAMNPHRFNVSVRVRVIIIVIVTTNLFGDDKSRKCLPWVPL